MIKEAEQMKQEDEKKKTEIELSNECDSLIHNTERSLNEHKDKIDTVTKDEIERALNDCRQAKNSGDVNKMKEYKEILNAAAMKIGQNMYSQQPGGGQGTGQPGGVGSTGGMGGMNPGEMNQMGQNMGMGPNMGTGQNPNQQQ